MKISPTTWARRGARAGFTLIEMSMSSLMFGLVAGSVLLVQVSSLNAADQAEVEARVESDARRALTRISDELGAASLGGLFPSPASPLGTPVINYQRATGVVTGNLTWGPVTRLAFEYEPGEIDDGIDNDSDGLIDEGQVVLTIDPTGPAPRRVVLTKGVSELFQGEVANGLDDNGNGVIDEAGFTVRRVGDALVLLLCLEGCTDRGLVVRRGVETRICTRN